MCVVREGMKSAGYRPRASRDPGMLHLTAESITKRVNRTTSNGLRIRWQTDEAVITTVANSYI